MSDITLVEVLDKAGTEVNLNEATQSVPVKQIVRIMIIGYLGVCNKLFINIG